MLPLSLIVVSVSSVDVSILEVVSRFVEAVGFVVGSVDDSVVKINFGSRMIGLEVLLLALTMMPPLTFTVADFDVETFDDVVGTFDAVVRTFDVVFRTFVVVVAEGELKTFTVLVLLEVAVVDLVVVVPEIEETFLFCVLTGGVMRIEGRFLGFCELFPL